LSYTSRWYNNSITAKYLTLIMTVVKNYLSSCKWGHLSR